MSKPGDVVVITGASGGVGRAAGRRFAADGARMGFSSRDSVVDSSHRVWGVPNLFVVDGSVFPTEGAANPALVIMALADRCASLMRSKRVAR